MTPAEISLAFAREVAGYPDAFWAGDYLDCGSAQRLPDYANDWNATIAAIMGKGLEWGRDYNGGYCWQWVRSGDVFGDVWGEGSVSDLCLAAIKCVREQQ